MPAHTSVLPSFLTTMPSCSSNRFGLNLASGVVMRITRLDGLFGGLGAPPAVHYALAGVGTDYYCKGRFSPDRDTAMSAATAYLGGVVGSVIFG